MVLVTEKPATVDVQVPLIGDFQVENFSCWGWPHSGLISSNCESLQQIAGRRLPHNLSNYQVRTHVDYAHTLMRCRRHFWPRQQEYR